MPRRQDGRPERPVTSHDVARAAGVSQSTVSRALRADPRVAAETRERVRAVAESLRYIPSEVGRSLSTRSTRRIGIVVTDIVNPFYQYLVAPLHDELEEAGYRMVLFTERREDAALLERLIDRSLDGVVLTTALVDSQVPHELAGRGVPFVFLNRTTDDIAADCVVCDNALGASLVGGEIARTGHARIGAIFGPPNTSTGRDRERGFRASLAAVGLGVPDELVRRGPYTFDTGYECIRELLALDDPPTAVFCGNDVIAIGAVNGAVATGFAVPDRLSLVGFDDLPMAGWEVFELTTVHQPIGEMARTAARLLVERIEAAHELPPRRRVFEPTFVHRRTLASLRDRR